MSTNDFEECWGKGVSQDDDMSMFIDSEDESTGNIEEEKEVGIDCLSEDEDEDMGMFFKSEEKEVINGLDDDGWLYQDDVGSSYVWRSYYEVYGSRRYK